MAVYAALLEHPASWDGFGAKVRQPFDFVVASLRAAGPLRARRSRGAAPGRRRRTRSRRWRAMNQPIWGAPGPDGWPEAAEAWISPPGLTARIDWASRLGEALAPRVDPRDFVEAALGDAGARRRRASRPRPRRSAGRASRWCWPRRSSTDDERARDRPPDAARAGLGAACCLAASPLVTPVVLAAAPGENRLVVIVLRGAMDGLAAFPPLGDPTLAALRPRLPPARRSSSTTASGCIRRSSRCCRCGGAGSSRWRRRWRRPTAASAATSTGRTCWRPAWRREPGRGRLAEPRADADPRRAGRDGAVGRAREHAAAARRRAGARLVARGSAAAAQRRARAARPALRGRSAVPARGAGGGGPERARGGRRGGGDGDDPIARFAGERLAAEARIAAFSIGGWDTHVAPGEGDRAAAEAAAPARSGRSRRRSGRPGTGRW